MTIPIPEFALVLLLGPSGCGKSSFARKHFKRTEILSSDFFRGMLSDDEMNQAASADAFEVLHLVCAKRLAAGHLTVIDATNVRPESRNPFLEMARRFHVQPVAIVFDFGAEFCHARNEQRAAERPFGPHVVRRHAEDLKRSASSAARALCSSSRCATTTDGATLRPGRASLWRWHSSSGRSNTMATF